MTFLKISLAVCSLFILLSGCKKDKSLFLDRLNNIDELRVSGKWELLYEKNLKNMNDGFPFYVIQLEAPVFFNKPGSSHFVPVDYFTAEFGDILFPVRESDPDRYFFHVRTVDGRYGWIDNSFGISLNYEDDPNLYFFSKEYYLTRYVTSEGNIDDPNRIILIKNFVPMLLDNFKTEGFFYPSDYELALKLSQLGLLMARDQDTYFHAASAYDWSVNEVVVTNNLIADSLQRLSRFDEAVAIHEKLIRSYFWKRSDNSPIGGLNSVVKLEKLYLDMLKKERQGSAGYNLLQKKIIDNIMITGNSYNIFTIIDREWHLSSAEWLLSILQNSLERNEFYMFCDLIAKKTTSSGFSDLVMVYKAVELYKEGQKEAAFKIFSNLKLKGKDNKLKLEDWLSAANIVPESVIYQYNF